MKLIPLALALGLLVFAPLLMTLALGLFSFDGLAAPQWLGWAAYQRMLDDALFQQSLRNSLLIAALSIPLRKLCWTMPCSSRACATPC